MARSGGKAALVLVTCASEEQAAAISRTLVSERLAACVNLAGPIRSIYRWRERIEDDREVLMLIKTRVSLIPRLERRVKELHTYEVPEVMAVRFDRGSSAYLAWMLEATASPKRRGRARK